MIPMNIEYHKIITIELGKPGGKPGVKGLRITMMIFLIDLPLA